jgi:hypothetical protein
MTQKLAQDFAVIFFAPLYYFAYLYAERKKLKHPAEKL